MNKEIEWEGGVRSRITDRGGRITGQWQMAKNGALEERPIEHEIAAGLPQLLRPKQPGPGPTSGRPAAASLPGRRLLAK